MAGQRPAVAMERESLNTCGGAGFGSKDLVSENQGNDAIATSSEYRDCW